MKKLSLLFAAFAVLLFASCGKYEDGPGLSLRSKKARIVGEWEVEKAVQAGVDITTELTFGGTAKLSFDKDNVYTYEYSYVYFGLPTSGTISGTWELSDDKSLLEITNGGGTAESSEILRLTNSELWIEKLDSNGSTYEIHYRAI